MKSDEEAKNVPQNYLNSKHPRSEHPRIFTRSEGCIDFLPKHLNGKSTIFKVAWLFTLALSIGLFAWHFSTLVDKYNDNSIETTIQQSSIPFDFPELMICNNIVTSLSSVTRNFKKMIEFTESVMIPMTINSTERGFSKFTDWMKITSSTVQSRTLTSIFGHEIKDMLLFCRYGDTTCKVDDFQEYYHDTYLRCWRFLPQNKNFTSYQLDIMLYSDTLLVKHPEVQMQGTPFSTVRFDGTVRWDVSGGLNLYIYPNGVAPVEASRLQIGSGNEVHIRLDQVDISGQNSAHKPCQTNTSEKVLYNDIDGDKQLNYTYNIEDCYKNALLKEFERKCCCFPKTRIPIFFNVTGKGKCYDFNAALNDLDMLRRANCAESVLAQKEAIYINSNCLNSCNRRHYIPTVSSVRWPLDEAVINTVNQFVKPKFQSLIANGFYSYGLQYFVNKSAEVLEALNILIMSDIYDSQYFAKLIDFEMKYTELLRDFRSNFLRLKIYAGESKGTLMEENFSYTLVSLFSDFGGIIGMYIDVCLLSMVIFMDYFYSLYKFSMYKIRRREFSSNHNASTQNKKLSDLDFQRAVKKAW